MEASEKNPLAAFVKADNYANAALAAEKTFEAVREDILRSEQYVVGIIQHENSETAALRSTGFADRFADLANADPKTAGKVRIITEVKPSANDNAYKTALEYLYEKDAGLIFATAIPVTHQLIDAIQASGGKYDGMKFTVYDMSKKTDEWLKMEAGAELIGAVDQNPLVIGKTAAETLIKLSRGEPVEKEVLVPGTWYSKDGFSR